MNIIDFISGKVEYDQHGGTYLWINQPNKGLQVLCEMRGYGAIQNLIKDSKGEYDDEESAKYQDKLGQFIAEAINEKIEREKLIPL